LAELLCCDCECVFCNSLVFYVSAFYFILWAAVSAGYPALLSSSYFERINDDDVYTILLTGSNESHRRRNEDETGGVTPRHHPVSSDDVSELEKPRRRLHVLADNFLRCTVLTAVARVKSPERKSLRYSAILLSPGGHLSRRHSMKSSCTEARSSYADDDIC